MRRLILTDTSETTLEQMYYAAICIADPDRAEKLYRVYREKNVQPNFWREAYSNIQYSENALISAIVNQLGMPFGAYVIERCDSQCIELAPWMYSSKFDREEFERGLFADDATEEYVRSQVRTLELTAAFLYWLDGYEKKHGKGK